MSLYARFLSTPCSYTLPVTRHQGVRLAQDRWGVPVVEIVDLLDGTVAYYGVVEMGLGFPLSGSFQRRQAIRHQWNEEFAAESRRQMRGHQ